MAEEWSMISRNSTNGRKMFRRMAPLRWSLRSVGAVAPRFAGRLGLRLFRTTLRSSLPARESEWVAAGKPIDLELNGERVGGWSWGVGPTVLLMHGWGGRASQMGALGLAFAAEGFQAVALDAPGHGTSPGRLSSLPEFADTVALGAREFGPIEAIVGHSFGAAGAGFSKAQGTEAQRLIFIAAPGDLHSYIGAFGELFGLSERVQGEMLRALEEDFEVRWQDCRFATTLAVDASPVLVVHDEGDGETHYEGALEIVQAWPESRLISTRGLGHRRILREPEVVQQIVDFVSGGSRAPEPVELGVEDSGSRPRACSSAS